MKQLDGCLADSNVTRTTSEASLYNFGYRYYSPRLGRWLNPDPVEEFGGANLYGYVKGAAVNSVDPLGLWNRDLHYGLTLELAGMAKIPCAADLAALANRPDEETDPPTLFKKAMALRVMAARLLSPVDDSLFPPLPPAMLAQEAERLLREADRLISLAAEWHFPVSANGEVVPDSTAANAKVKQGKEECNFKLFSMGLHVLQDSWSHQGKPYWEGLGHARGAQYVSGREDVIYLPTGGVIRVGGGGGYWRRLTGLEAAFSHSADDVTIWPVDARAAGSRTYEWLLDFKKACPCACPGPNDTCLLTSSGKAEPQSDVDRWLLNTKYPGENKVR